MTGTLSADNWRSASSVGANIAEGSGRGSNADNRRFLRIALGSLYETNYWLRCARIDCLLVDTHATRLQNLIDELIPRLHSYRNSLGAKPNDQG